MPVDLSVFQRHKSLLDQQALQEEFELRKQLGAMQAAQAIKQLTAPEIGIKDMLALQMQK